MPERQTTPEELEYLLHKLVFRCAAFGHFCAQYIDDVSERGFNCEEAVERVTAADDSGEIEVFVMADGIAVAHFTALDFSIEKWAAYQTRERVARQASYARWASFARGSWTLACPTEPGTYPVVPLDAAVGRECPFTVYTDFHLRFVARVDGVVRDVTNHCPSHLRTEWQGYWWSEALPLMDAPIK